MMRTGMTLLELMVVVLVLGAAAAIVGPAIGSRLRRPVGDSASIARRALGEATLGDSSVVWRDSMGRSWRALPDGRLLGPGSPHAPR
jgi:prepilin-type N-terminal cleavage/methylation domain-containing protein